MSDDVSARQHLHVTKGSDTAAPPGLVTLVAPQRWCGQDQPHGQHTWTMEGGFYASCAGHLGTSRSPGVVSAGWIEVPFDASAYDDDDQDLDNQET